MIATKLYAIRSSAGPVRIGSSRCPERRVREVSYCHRHGVSGALTVELALPVPANARPRIVEGRAHNLARGKRVVADWYDLTPREVASILKRAIVGEGTPARLIRKIFMMPRELVERIADYRYANRIPSEAEAVRLLIEKGLAAEGFLRQNAASKRKR